MLQKIEKAFQLEKEKKIIRQSPHWRDDAELIMEVING
jgi:hypothetical protein